MIQQMTKELYECKMYCGQLEQELRERGVRIESLAGVQRKYEATRQQMSQKKAEIQEKLAAIKQNLKRE